MVITLSFWELILTPIFLVVVLIISLLSYRSMKSNDPCKPHFLAGMWLKIIGGIMVGLIYYFYYGLGDTLSYYQSGLILKEMSYESLGAYLRLLFAKVESIADIDSGFKRMHGHFYSDSSYLISKIVSVLAFFAFDSYFVISIYFSLFSFWGVWKLYRVFCHLYPGLEKEMAIAVLYVPSVFFWGSGIMKDPLCIGAMGLLVDGVYNIFFLKRKRFRSLFLIVASAYVLYMVKVYILLGMGAGVMVWLLLKIKSGFRVPLVRAFVLPALTLFGILFMSFFLGSIRAQLEALAFQNFMEMALAKLKFNADLTLQGGSAYDLGEIDPTGPGALKVAPKAIVLSLYRPYIWETRKIVQFLSALENFVLLGFSFYLLWKTRVFGFIKVIFSDSNLLFFLVFTLVLGFMVGVSSGNFGNLVRYKIPTLPFFVAILLVVHHHLKQAQKSRAAGADQAPG